MKKKSSTMDLSLSANERLFLDSDSPFKPKKYKNYLPNGFKIYTFHAGFKKASSDLLIIIFDQKVNSVNVFSKTFTPSAPIIWDKKNVKGMVKALIVNSGNANAHTGKAGINIIEKYVNFLSKKIECKKNEILVSSTGVIGEIFDPKLIINQINKIKLDKNTDLFDAAKSIMTTDTYPKISVQNIKIGNISFKAYGIAKGSGMIKPNMATMLAYIFIEIDVPKNLLKKIIHNNIEQTFNSISVDSDTSTSDTLSIFSIRNKFINLKNIKNFKLLDSKIHDLMKDLSQQVIKDGEGITKLIEVTVKNAKTKKQAKQIGFSIVNSPLVKTAISGEDANWGRVIMAIGKSEENINQNKIKIYFGNTLVCRNGEKYKKIKINNLNNYMKNKVIKIIVYIENGKQHFTVFGNDLSYEYIRINGDYRS